MNYFRSTTTIYSINLSYKNLHRSENFNAWGEESNEMLRLQGFIGIVKYTCASVFR